MKQVKGFILVLAGLFVMITMVSLLMPSKVMTVRSVVIHANEVIVFSKMQDLRKWKEWHPVFRADSNSIRITQPSSGVHAAATWTSNSTDNKLLITEQSNSHVKFSLMRKGENDVINILSINPVADSSAIQVEWRALTRIKWYPWEKFYGIFIDKITGPGYESALNALKEVSENSN